MPEGDWHWFSRCQPSCDKRMVRRSPRHEERACRITLPEGHVVLDGGYPTTAPMIMARIARLGFDIKDVKVLVNSEPHPDHGRRDDSRRTDRAHRAHHRRPHTRLHVVVILRPRWRPGPERGERV